jgi:hypothetical protein
VVQTVSIVKPGKDLTNIALKFGGKDSYFDHHVIQSTEPSCQRQDHGGEHFYDCGPVAKGTTKDITITTVVKDAGNFDYKVSLWDIQGEPVLLVDPKGDDTLTWSEVVNP